MNGKERVLAMLGGAPVDHLPLMPITMMFAADTAGVPYQQYASDHHILAEAQVLTAEQYGFDHVSAISDPARETADLGGAIEWFADQPPAVIESQALLAYPARLATLQLPPMTSGRMRDRIDGVALLKRRTGETRVVEGWVEGPCALAADLRGLNRLMLDFHDDPTLVRDLFEFVVTMEVEFARAQVAAGADLIGIGDAASSLIGPKRYEAFVFPYEQRLIQAIRTLGARVRLHICGNTRKILPWIGACGAELVDLDFLCPLGEARSVLGPEQVLLGNIDPVRTLRDGTPESVTAALEECLRQAGPRYIVGAGCEVPRGTPTANLHAMADFARSHALP
jgi:MtaA/CmuA family methyltransferase